MFVYFLAFYLYGTKIYRIFALINYLKLNNMNLLTISEAQNLIGKKISWSAPIYKYNTGFFGEGIDGGISIIKEVNPNLRNPISAEILEGANMNNVFNEWGAGRNTEEPLCFSDGDRYVSFKIVSDD